MTHPALRGIPTGQRVNQVTSAILSGWKMQTLPASVILRNEYYRWMRSLPRISLVGQFQTMQDITWQGEPFP
jgi:hypothetical protein